MVNTNVNAMKTTLRKERMVVFLIVEIYFEIILKTFLGKIQKNFSRKDFKYI
tara:strand:- start:184 stop:339 length:156 start_codon:yes stop_codon:yes gene_type:complete